MNSSAGGGRAVPATSAIHEIAATGRLFPYVKRVMPQIYCRCAMLSTREAGILSALVFQPQYPVDLAG